MARGCKRRALPRNNIQRLLHDAGITQLQLAARAGLQLDTTRKLTHSKAEKCHNIPARSYLKYAIALGMAPARLWPQWFAVDPPPALLAERQPSSVHKKRPKRSTK